MHTPRHAITKLTVADVKRQAKLLKHFRRGLATESRTVRQLEAKLVSEYHKKDWSESVDKWLHATMTLADGYPRDLHGTVYAQHLLNRIEKQLQAKLPSYGLSIDRVTLRIRWRKNPAGEYAEITAATRVRKPR